MGTKEIGLAVLATTLSLVVVFLPVSFLDSVTGRMLYEFGVTASAAIMVSLLVSFSLTPMMCSRLLRPPKAATGQEPRILISAMGALVFVTTMVSGLDYVITYSRKAVEASRRKREPAARR